MSTGNFEVQRQRELTTFQEENKGRKQMISNSDLKSGHFYWVLFVEDGVSGDQSIGQYDGIGEYPWTVVGSERLFKFCEIQAIEDLGKKSSVSLETLA